MFDPNALPALNDEMEAFLTEQNVNDETRYMWRKYYPIAWGKPSPHVDAIMIMTGAALMMHARGEEAASAKQVRLDYMDSRTERRKARASREQFGAEWLAWQAQCAQRNAWIESLAAEWRKRVNARKAAMAEWDKHVSEARNAFNAGKATQAPPQPMKVAQAPHTP